MGDSMVIYFAGVALTAPEQMGRCSMDQYIIRGGTALHGEVEISGAKNAAVAIIPAALLVKGVCRIENIPQISDTDTLLTILTQLGARVSYLNKSTIEIDCTDTRYQDAPYDLMRKIRASYYLIGSMLGRFGSAKTTMPGGCNFGVRPIDQHIKGMRALGAEISVKNGFVYADTADGRLHGARIYLDKVSVGATMNIMIAAVLAEGRTIIENAAREPPDQIEAGTYMVAAAATGGEILIKNIIPKHMEGISAKLRETGTVIEEYEETLLVKGPTSLRRINLKTMPYPGFPTDMQPQFGVLLCLANGTSVITEGIYDNRFKYVNELRKMGAEIQVDGRVAVIDGGRRLTGAPVHACDLRAGAAMVIAGMVASGVTEIDDIHFIERGYERFVEKLNALGADIRVHYDEEDALSARAFSAS